MQRKRVLWGLLAVALVAGATAGALKAHADGGCWMVPIIHIEAVGAQDTNNDGIATLLEAEYDFDGDGIFTRIDAESLGNCRMLVDGSGGMPVGGTWKGKQYCLLDFTKEVYTCIYDVRFDCYKSGSTCYGYRDHVPGTPP